MSTPANRLRALAGGGDAPTPPTGRLRVAPHAGPSRPMTETTPLAIGCRHVDGTPASFAEVIRAVYAGEADPSDYAVALDARHGQRAMKA